MGWRWLPVLLGLLAALPSAAAAQDRPDRSVNRAVMLPPGTPVVSVAASVNEIGASDDVAVSAKRLADELSERLRPIEVRVQSDARLRSAGALVGLSAVAVGALRGQRTLAVAGAEVIRLGLNHQLDVVRARTGFSVTPSLGDHRFTVTFSRNF